MKSESVVTALIGIILGAVVAFLLLFNTKVKIKQEKKIIAKKESIIPTVPASEEKNRQSLIIEKPDNEIISQKNIITIKGQANKDSVIIIQSPSAEKVIKNNESKFSVDFPLAPGENLINITAYLTKGETEEKELKIYYFAE